MFLWTENENEPLNWQACWSICIRDMQLLNSCYLSPGRASPEHTLLPQSTPRNCKGKRHWKESKSLPALQPSANSCHYTGKHLLYPLLRQGFHGASKLGRLPCDPFGTRNHRRHVKNHLDGISYLPPSVLRKCMRSSLVSWILRKFTEGFPFHPSKQTFELSNIVSNFTY